MLPTITATSGAATRVLEAENARQVGHADAGADGQRDDCRDRPERPLTSPCNAGQREAAAGQNAHQHQIADGQRHKGQRARLVLAVSGGNRPPVQRETAGKMHMLDMDASTSCCQPISGSSALRGPRCINPALRLVLEGNRADRIDHHLDQHDVQRQDHRWESEQQRRQRESCHRNVNCGDIDQHLAQIFENASTEAHAVDDAAEIVVEQHDAGRPYARHRCRDRPSPARCGRPSAPARR